MYKCPKCKILLNEVVDGEYKCPQCEWHLSELYVQAWWHGYQARAAEQMRAADAIYCVKCGDEILSICGDCNGEN